MQFKQVPIALAVAYLSTSSLVGQYGHSIIHKLYTKKKKLRAALKSLVRTEKTGDHNILACPKWYYR